MDSSDKRLKTIKNGLSVLLGNGQQVNDNLIEVTEYLFQRDFPKLFDLNEQSTKVQDFVPDFFLTKAFNNLKPGQEKERLCEINSFLKENPDKANQFLDTKKSINEAQRVTRGDQAEMHFLEALKNYLSNKDEICIVFHGHNLYNIDITMPGKETPNLVEKDFIIVNLTCRYIMVIEVKNTYGAGKSAEKADKQLRDAMESIQAYFGADIDESWSYIPVVYCTQVKDNETPSGAYLIQGKFNKTEIQSTSKDSLKCFNLYNLPS